MSDSQYNQFKHQDLEDNAIRKLRQLGLYETKSYAVAQHTENFKKRLHNLVKNIQYKDGWELLVSSSNVSNMWLQWKWNDNCSVTGDVNVPLKSAKHRLSIYMTDTEIVNLAFYAALKAEEHETRDWFKFDGQAIFSGHMSIYDRVKLMKESEFKIDARS